jgi:hypothetical protein
VFDWLFEGRLPVYIALAAAAVLLYFFWRQSRRRVFLYAAGACLALVAAYFLLDKFVETDREQIGRKLQEMSAAVRAGDVDRIFANVSDDFKRGTANKAGFRQQAERVIRGGVNEVEIWNVTVADDPSGGPAGVEFFAKPRGGIADGTAFYLIRARMKRDPDGQWRLQGFDAFNPYSDSNTPLQIPELPH